MSRRRGVVRGATVVVLWLLLTACAGEAGAWQPRSRQASIVLWLFWVMLGLAAVVFVLVVALLVRAARAGDPAGVAGDAGEQAAERRARRLVLGGGVLLPVVVLVPLSIATLTVAASLSHRVGPPALPIEVIGHQYWWEIRYPDHGVVTANEIHIPVGTPVELTLTTEDVIHSVWVPQLSGKVDMIPGEVTELRFEADTAGTYLGQCAELCGLQHARMRLHVVAEPLDRFEAWVARQAEPAAAPEPGSRAEAGAEVFVEAGCAACHTVRGTGAAGELGPDLTHVADRLYLGAGTLRNDRGQLAGWVANPHASKPGALMPPSSLEPEELLAVVDYLETLR
ncbi:MAG: cytochrome c oxidase subunit II [Acidimicrobiales bacterium]